MEEKSFYSSTVLAQVTDLYVAGIMTVFLLWPGTRGYAGITQQKAWAYFMMTGGYLAVILLIRLVFRKDGGMPAPNWRGAIKKLTLPQWLILGYWGFSALSAMCSVDRAISLMGGPRAEGLLTISLYCGSFLLVSFFGRAGCWMLALFGVSMSANCVLALSQLAGHNPLGLYPEGMNYYDGLVRYAGQFLGTVGNVDLLSALLALGIPVFWIGLLRLEDRRKYLLVVPLGLCLAVLGWVWVEGGVVAVLGGLILGIPVVLKTQRQRRRAAAVAGAVLVLGFAGVYVFGERVGGFVFEAHELLHGRVEDSFGSGRIYIWRNVLELVSERLLLGGGPETLGLRTDAAFERYDPHLGLVIRSAVDVAHNEYLNVLVNQGLPALVCMLGALVTAAVRWVKRSPENPAAAVCGGAVLGYCIQAFFGIGSPITAPFFWTAFGLLVRELNK